MPVFEPIEKIDRFEKATWGESHGVFLDKKGRIYTCGTSSDGRLGLPDTNLPAKVSLPTQLTFGLPEPKGGAKVIEI